MQMALYYQHEASDAVAPVHLPRQDVSGAPHHSQVKLLSCKTSGEGGGELRSWIRSLTKWMNCPVSCIGMNMRLATRPMPIFRAQSCSSSMCDELYVLLLGHC